MIFNKYTTDFLVFFIIIFGAIFMSVGLIAYTGNISISEQSEIQDSTQLGHVFTALGTIAFSIGVVSATRYYKRKKIRRTLIAQGIPVTGFITSVSRQVYLKFNGRSPYIIYYSYTHLGKVYNAKSHFLWGRMEYEQDEEIPVYVDDFGNSAIDI